MQPKVRIFRPKGEHSAGGSSVVGKEINQAGSLGAIRRAVRKSIQWAVRGSRKETEEEEQEEEGGYKVARRAAHVNVQVMTPTDDYRPGV